MGFYIVKLDPNKGGRSLRNGSDVMIVSAADATSAKQAAASKFESEGSAWTDASTTATAIAAAADWSGWTVQVAILGGFGTGADPFVVSVAGDATNNTMDEIAALLVTALNASASIAGASYDAATNILTVAATTDALGDQTVQAKFIPPGSAEAVPSLVGAIVDGGAAADALTLTLPADAAVIPAVLGYFKQA